MLKKMVLTSISKTYFLGRKKRNFSLAKNIERKYFREIQLHKKESSVKSMWENKKTPIKLFKWFLLSYYCCTITKSCIVVDRKIARKIPLDKKQRRAIIFCH